MGASLMAIVPESECRMPTLIGSLAWARRRWGTPRPAERPAPAARVVLRKLRRDSVGIDVSFRRGWLAHAAGVPRPTTDALVRPPNPGFPTETPRHPAAPLPGREPSSRPGPSLSKRRARGRWRDPDRRTAGWAEAYAGRPARGSPPGAASAGSGAQGRGTLRSGGRALG